LPTPAQVCRRSPIPVDGVGGATRSAQFHLSWQAVGRFGCPREEVTMLRRAESVSVRFVRDHRFSHYGEIRVLLGRDQTVIGWGHRDEFQRAAMVHQTRPQFVVRAGERNYWQFRDRFFWDNDGLDRDEVHAVLATREQRDRARVRRAQEIFASDVGTPVAAGRRPGIPDDVKHLVYTRDGGRCRHCGAHRAAVRPRHPARVGRKQRCRQPAIAVRTMQSPEGRRASRPVLTAPGNGHRPSGDEHQPARGIPDLFHL